MYDVKYWWQLRGTHSNVKPCTRLWTRKWFSYFITLSFIVNVHNLQLYDILTMWNTRDETKCMYHLPHSAYIITICLKIWHNQRIQHKTLTWCRTKQEWARTASGGVRSGRRRGGASAHLRQAVEFTINYCRKASTLRFSMPDCNVTCKLVK